MAEDVEVEWWDQEEEIVEIHTGDTPTREASTGGILSATPSTRRVLFEILLPWIATDHADQVAYVHTSDERRDCEVKLLEAEEEKSTGDAPTREASTGGTLSATPPASWNIINSNDIYTHAADPFKLDRVAEILKKVVHKFLREFTDILALSVGEVNVAPGAVYAPRIPPEARFNTGVVHQRPWTLLLSIDANTQINVLEAAGIIRRMDPQEVKSVNPISLAEKEHGQGMTLNELVHELEAQCVLPCGPKEPVPPSWRICGNFAEQNEYIFIFDFTSEFFVLEVAKEVQPYLSYTMHRWLARVWGCVSTGDVDGLTGWQDRAEAASHGVHSKKDIAGGAKLCTHLQEFAALKFSLDQFSDVIWGQPVTLEKDCSTEMGKMR
ncbi:hypothetical protein B0H16DRAFT_1720847 [Mycena metata]|uniref:Uncharacterized protein n=1 Tax=Mycena metata TaxID=1033252 RepID=A0AAD7J9X8_9AGAR|nr:hypothetical protein B0H16DRAFT_1720847 [Mycena metata]